MNALMSAELLRLRTVRSPRWLGLGGLVFVALTAWLNLRDLATSELADAMRLLAVVAILFPAVTAATLVGGEFQRGSAALTYLSHPDRTRVAAARSLVYAGLGALFAAAAAGAIAIVGSDAGLSAAQVAQLVGGAAVGAAILCAVGVLLGTVTRNPTVAGVALVAVNVAETFFDRAGAGPYLPFGLLKELMGASGGPSALTALGLLLAYFAAFFVLVQRFALPRDLT